MSNIRRLINELCPDGVPHQPLSKVASFTRGGGPQKKDFRKNGELCLHYGQIYTRFGVSTSQVVSYIESDVFTKSRKAFPGDVIIADTSENDADLAKAVAWLGEGPIAVSNHTLIAHTSLDPSYLSYFLRSSLFQRQKQKYISGTKVRTISADGLGKVRIPVPPLEVQREIVRILDGFTKLEAELEARRKQYAFYRDQLLTFTPKGERTKWLPLHSIATRIVTGATPKAGNPRFYDDGDVPWIRTQEVNYSRITAAKAFITKEALEETSVKMVHAPAVVVAISGATAGRVATLEIDATTNQHCCNIEFDTQRVDHRFVYYWLVSQHDLLIGKKQGVRGDLNLSMIKSLLIPVPPLEEQRRIVAILDKFDALVNDISSGLPAEIEARRKQYEHYRDRLLTFPELNG
ncbi:restriction endonuclease subunit S [Trueperella pyogenes]|uniref:restriction endonuclease subunit S n=1 Tax=Trueperella pyogenes TaxID=1661 RepID=UPI003132DE34